MKINQQVLNLPPYISTSWKNVTALHTKLVHQEKVLVVTLTNNSVIEIPSLSEDVLRKIFEAHSLYIERSQSPSSKEDKPKPSQTSDKNLNSNPFALGGENTLTFGFPLKAGDLESMGQFSSMMQHNLDQANASDLPPEVLEKITSIAKAIGLDKQLDQFPKAEPHCNCPFCQLSRAFHGEKKTCKTKPQEEAVSDEDLTFREWDIKEINKTLFEVTNPFDKSEQYQVFLGQPIGCTCGQKNCEHIKAVLKS